MVNIKKLILINFILINCLLYFMPRVVADLLPDQALIHAKIAPFRTFPDWVKAENGKIAKNAVGFYNSDQKIIYLCRAHLFNNIIPGQVKGYRCSVTYGGKVFLQSEYEILILDASRKAGWPFPNNVPFKEVCYTHYTPGPVEAPSYLITSRHSLSLALPFRMPSIGNFSKNCTKQKIDPYPVGIENDQQLFICVAVYKGSFHIGKLSGNQCSISSQNDEIQLPPYQLFYVLVKEQPHPALNLVPTNF